MSDTTVGSTFISRREAASLLGVADRTIRVYVRKGMLRTQREGMEVLVHRDDVAELKKIQVEPISVVINKYRLAQLFSRVAVLESNVATLMRLMNLRRSPLSLTGPELLALHKVAESYCCEGWPPHAEEMWADLFARFSHTEFELLEKVTDGPHGWVPFYRLCSTMFLRPFDKELTDQFAYGKHNLHNLATVWNSLKGMSPTKIVMMLRDDAAPLKRLVNRLGRIQSKPPTAKARASGG